MEHSIATYDVTHRQWLAAADKANIAAGGRVDTAVFASICSHPDAGYRTHYFCGHGSSHTRCVLLYLSQTQTLDWWSENLVITKEIESPSHLES